MDHWSAHADAYASSKTSFAQRFIAASAALVVSFALTSGTMNLFLQHGARSTVSVHQSRSVPARVDVRAADGETS